MGKITDISQQKKHTHLYNIFVDESFYCSVSDMDISILNIRVGSELSQINLENIKSNSEINKTYDRALYYLQYGPRTKQQMRKYLLQKGYNEVYIDKVIKKLVSNNYINDKQYTINFIEEKQIHGLKSNSYIKAQLIKKGIDKSIIDNCLKALNESNQCDIIKELATKKYSQGIRYKDKQKMTQYLLRQGFNYSDISKTLDELGLVFGSNKKMYNNSY